MWLAYLNIREWIGRSVNLVLFTKTTSSSIHLKLYWCHLLSQLMSVHRPTVYQNRCLPNLSTYMHWVSSQTDKPLFAAQKVCLRSQIAFCTYFSFMYGWNKQETMHYWFQGQGDKSGTWDLTLWLPLSVPETSKTNPHVEKCIHLKLPLQYNTKCKKWSGLNTFVKWLCIPGF